MTTIARALLLLLASLLGLGPAHAQEAGAVAGRVTLALADTRLEDVGAVVLFLAGPDGRLDYRVPEAVPAIAQVDARFVPSFLVVTAGQTLALPNRDVIFHNVFSYSRPNDFDLGLYPRGESRTVKMRYPGFVRLYCSIHESMSASVFVAPSPWWTVARPSGEFVIQGIPPGRYELRSWARRLPSAARELRVAPGQTQRVELSIGGRSGTARLEAP